eukprot:NODE_758_length_1190_cov_105.989483_g540_i0.p1 GENE.NODE_758_length_1190_cov_105.989483_g540_i0~~NODE_758_length_1190_cov_105.989483_g540_i0.p1  ORF type:complete len:375 (+),score=115.10 NODE_758_length_1190_cov_105.989483_g540_i0:38-1162(+)
MTNGKCKVAGLRWWAFSGMLLCMVFFVGYLVYQVKTNQNEEVQKEKVMLVQTKALEENSLTLTALCRVSHDAGAEMRGLLPKSLSLDPQNPELRRILRPFFVRYDKDCNGTLDTWELGVLLTDLGEKPSGPQFKKLLAQTDKDGDGRINFNEFISIACRYSATLSATGSHGHGHGHGHVNEVRTDRAPDEAQEDDDQEDEPEMPEDLADLTPEQQQFRIKLRAAWMLGVGTLVVLLFSDPMVDVLSNIGDRIGIAPFYISFVLAPLASNASELIASYNYALKKSEKTISISFSALLGAATMNNTFCLGIFLALVFFRNLAWEFSAETISILVVELAMFAVALNRRHPLWTGVLVLACYPVSLLVVIILEHIGLD